MRVPYRIYSDPEIYAAELERLFYGRYWHYIGLTCEIPAPGDVKRAVIGERSVLAVHAEDGAIGVFLNRCRHRGVELCQQTFMHRTRIVCPYHQWSYDLQGKLQGVPFRNGLNGRGGFPEDFDVADFGLVPLQTHVVNGLIFASFASDPAPFEESVGREVYPWITRLFDGRELRVLGYQRQRIACNWKLYMENLKDSYHATLLHVFLISFGLARAGQNGVQLQDARTYANSVATAVRTEPGKQLGAESEMRSLRANLVLHDSSVVDGVTEFADETSLAIQAHFPNLVFQQQVNSLQIRHVVPLGPDEFELSWTYFGYAGDDDAMTERRLSQANLTGAAGYIAVDDTEVLSYSGAGIRTAAHDAGLVQLGGREPVRTPENGKKTLSEVSIRGFYHHYFKEMDITP